MVGVPVADVVAEAPVDAEISREQDAFLRKEGHRVADGMGGADSPQLQPSFTIVDGHVGEAAI